MHLLVKKNVKYYQYKFNAFFCCATYSCSDILLHGETDSMSSDAFEARHHIGAKGAALSGSGRKTAEGEHTKRLGLRAAILTGVSWCMFRCSNTTRTSYLTRHFFRVGMHNADKLL